MSDILSSPASPNPRKRAAPDMDTADTKPLNLTGTQFIVRDAVDSSNPSPTGSNEMREGSPALSISTMTSVDIVGSTVAGDENTPSTAGNAGTKGPPAKKRKLTPSEKLDRLREKEAKAREKEAKDAEKAELKARKDEEKRVKDEEKRQKAEEREAKKREKELEEQRKEEAKLKKQRSQLRLGAFFGAKPATPGKDATPDGTGTVSARRKSLSLDPFDAVADQIRRSASPSKNAPPQQAAPRTPTPAPTKPLISDYHKHFLPFEVREHVTMAATYSIPNPDDLAYWQGEYDREIKNPSLQEKADLGMIEPTAVVDIMFERGTKRGLPLPSMRAIVDHIQGSPNEPIDLTQDGPVQQPLETAIQQATRRYLHFESDVRPPYFGTYTQIRSPRTARRLMLDPFSRERKDTDYDYDSEAEWEEPEEGDDDVDEEEEEAESQGDADEMDGFLDDEDDQKNKRKLITGDLQPKCTGLCWEDTLGVVVQSIEATDTTSAPDELKDMRIGVLIPGFSGCTIDPFSTVYWAHEMAPPSVPLDDALARPPLKERASNGALTQKSLLGAAEGQKGPITSVAASQAAKRGPKPQPKVLSKEDLDEFKEAVVGSDAGKVDLQKALKLRFPKMTNDTIKEVLSTRFASVGAKGHKHWVFVPSTAAE
ncbi:hypothetical protein LTR17_007530 [Elasticomyces elasticus]|nr:hypothetical protein LTR17_007530 [Elasticomyces elasticus]